MRVALLQQPRRMQVVQVAEPVPTTDQPILLRMRSGGICGSDLHTYRGLHPFRRPPVVLGHEGAGVVESVPAGERRISVGDRVAVMPVLSCWDCARCETGISHLCAHKRVPGSGWPGLLSEYVTAPARVLIPLHDGIDLSEGAMIEPVAVAWHAARSAGITAGESVAVLGAGPIGSLVARVCQLHHVRTLLASDAKEYNVQFLRRLGISDAINVTRDDVVAAGRDLTGDAGFDAVVIASGHPTGMAEALALCRPRGRIVVLPMFGGALSVDLNPLVLKEVSVAGSTIYRPDDFAAAARLVNTRELDVRPFITEVVPLAESPAALQAIDAGADHVKIQIDLTR